MHGARARRRAGAAKPQTEKEFTDAVVGLLRKSGGTLGVNKIGNAITKPSTVPAKLMVYLASKPELFVLNKDKQEVKLAK